jgi:hypothetical protein
MVPGHRLVPPVVTLELATDYLEGTLPPPVLTELGTKAAGDAEQEAVPRIPGPARAEK